MWHYSEFSLGQQWEVTYRAGRCPWSSTSVVVNTNQTFVMMLPGDPRVPSSLISTWCFQLSAAPSFRLYDDQFPVLRSHFLLHHTNYNLVNSHCHMRHALSCIVIDNLANLVTWCTKERTPVLMNPDAPSKVIDFLFHRIC